jgi:hypothetical protein
MRTFEEFSKQVRESVDQQAKRKGYTEKNIDEENKLAAITKLMGIQAQHGAGEIVYKITEYLKNPREVLLIKIAGWCYILWREHAAQQ